MSAVSTTPGTGFATAADWARFFKPVAVSVRNTPSDAEFKARIAAIAHALPHVPAEWLASSWRQQEAMTTWQWWPSVADVAAWLAPYQAEMRESRARAAASDAPRLPAPERPTTRTAEELAAVRASVATVRDILSTHERAETGSTIKARPLPLSDGQLAAVCEAIAGDPSAPEASRRLAALRLSGLRRRLETAA